MAAHSIIIEAGASSTYDGKGYSLNPALIRIGDTVTWTNSDSSPHTITSGRNGTPDGKFNSSPAFNPLLAPEKTFSHTFTEEGDYYYFCALHPNEVGILQVLRQKRTGKAKTAGRKEGPIHGHFFFVDIVGLSDQSKGGTESQIKKIQVLHRCISKCKAYRSATGNKKYINLTGDGMVIGFLEGPQLPLNLAIELHQQLNHYNQNKQMDEKISVRIGIDSAPILRYRDILGKMNVWGDGIVIAKRIMDRGSSNDILLSGSAAAALTQFDKYRRFIEEAEEVEIKHGRLIKIFFAHGKDFGSGKPNLGNDDLQYGTTPFKNAARSVTGNARPPDRNLKAITLGRTLLEELSEAQIALSDIEDHIVDPPLVRLRYDMGQRADQIIRLTAQPLLKQLPIDIPTIREVGKALKEIENFQLILGAQYLNPFLAKARMLLNIVDKCVETLRGQLPTDDAWNIQYHEQLENTIAELKSIWETSQEFQNNKELEKLRDYFRVFGYKFQILANLVGSSKSKEARKVLIETARGLRTLSTVKGWGGANLEFNHIEHVRPEVEKCISLAEGALNSLDNVHPN